LSALYGIPEPQVNARVDGLEVDCLWPARRVIVELDGYAFHGNRAAFERDRLRDLSLQRLGYRVVRLTFRQIDQQPASVMAALAELLTP
jgi:very-short-patch-repair endonuclease